MRTVVAADSRPRPPPRSRTPSPCRRADSSGARRKGSYPHPTTSAPYICTLARPHLLRRRQRTHWWLCAIDGDLHQAKLASLGDEYLHEGRGRRHKVEARLRLAHSLSRRAGRRSHQNRCVHRECMVSFVVPLHNPPAQPVSCNVLLAHVEAQMHTYAPTTHTSQWCTLCRCRVVHHACARLARAAAVLFLRRECIHRELRAELRRDRNAVHYAREREAGLREAHNSARITEAVRR